MAFNLLIAFSILFVGIPGIINYSFRKDTNRVMKRINSKFSGHVNNSFDFFRIIKAYKYSKELNINEKRKLRVSIILVSISWIAGLIIIISFIFFTDQILN